MQCLEIGLSVFHGTSASTMSHCCTLHEFASTIIGQLGLFDGDEIQQIADCYPTCAVCGEVIKQHLLLSGLVLCRTPFGGSRGGRPHLTHESASGRMQVAQQTLVIVGDKDLMLPSSDEGKTLEKLLPNCRSKTLPNCSHALLQEAGVDLVDLLDAEGFFVGRRQQTGTAAATGPRRASAYGR
jgi:hypothetical protein